MFNIYENALCADYASELWFPPAQDEDPQGTDSQYFEIAKMVCSVCQHRSECAVAGEDERWGVWGGTTPAERRRGSSRASKRLMNEDAFELLPPAFDENGLPTHVDLQSLRNQIREVTRKRQQA